MKMIMNCWSFESHEIMKILTGIRTHLISRSGGVTMVGDWLVAYQSDAEYLSPGDVVQ